MTHHYGRSIPITRCSLPSAHYSNKDRDIVLTFGDYLYFHKWVAVCIYWIVLCEECLHDQASIGLEIGANFGTNCSGTDSCPYGKEIGGILTTQGVMCHAQVVGGSEVSKYKMGRFFGRQNAGASNQETLLMKYLDQRCKIGAKKPHQ